MPGEKIIPEIVRRVAVEFRVARRDILNRRQGDENFVRLMAISLVRELSRLEAHAIGRAFGISPANGADRACRHFAKYLRHIPGLRKKYEKLKRELQKKLVNLNI